MKILADTKTDNSLYLKADKSTCKFVYTFIYVVDDVDESLQP